MITKYTEFLLEHNKDTILRTLGLNDINNFTIKFDFYTEDVSYDDSGDLYYYYNNDKDWTFLYLKYDDLLLIHEKYKIINGLENYIIDLMKKILNNTELRVNF